MPERLLHLTRPLLAVLSGVGANIAAAVASSQSGSLSVSTVVGAITVAVLAICGMIVAISPVIANAIIKFAQTIGPAVAELQKQREEIKKGTYTGQIEELKEMITELKEDYAKAKEDLAQSEAERAERDKRYAEREQASQEREERLEDSLQKARKGLHEIRDKLGTDILARDVKIMELEASRDAKFQEFEEEIKRLRSEIERLSALLAAQAASQDKRIEDNAAAIQTLSEQRAGDAA